MDEFRKRTGAPDDPWDRRLVKRFGLIYAAARLAAELHVVPWSAQTIESSIVKCYRGARMSIPDAGQLVAEGLEQLRKSLKAPGCTVDMRYGRPVDPEDLARAFAIRRRIDDKRSFFAIRREKFMALFQDERRAKLVLQLLDQHQLAALASSNS